MSPPKEKRLLCGAPLKTAGFPQTYYILLALQAGMGRAGSNGEANVSRDPFHQQDDIRHCVCCGVVVTNDSLGGHARKSALARALWCYDCA